MTIQEFLQQNLPDYDKRSTDIALRVEKIINSNMTSRQKMDKVSAIYDKLFSEALTRYREYLILQVGCLE